MYGNKEITIIVIEYTWIVKVCQYYTVAINCLLYTSERSIKSNQRKRRYNRVECREAIHPPRK